MIIHQRVQIAPVPMRAKFCVSDRFSAGRAKSATPARTSPHFIMGALSKTCMLVWFTAQYTTQDRQSMTWDNEPEVHCLGANGALP